MTAHGGDGTPSGDVRLRELYDSLVPGLGRWRAEIIDRRLIIGPRGTPGERWMTAVLSEALAPLARERGWRVHPGLDVCLPGAREPFEPDFAMASKDAPRWGEREVFTDGLVMVGEIVSPASVAPAPARWCAFRFPRNRPCCESDPRRPRID
ncbi:hypothetical protein GCM10010151_28210 [Actinoallomurus spadix]|uniref:Uncharacterized protein n=1 Tax=Actinoallomurus spadix TaxID=79912 RepID=A0ABN0WGF2_9ACTN